MRLAHSSDRPTLALLLVLLVLVTPCVTMAQGAQVMKNFTFHSAATAGDGEAADVNGLNLVGVSLSGSAGSDRVVTFEVLDRIGAYVAVNCLDVTTRVVSTTATVTSTTPRRFQCSVGGFKYFRVRISGGTTGTLSAVGLGLTIGAPMSSSGGLIVTEIDGLPTGTATTLKFSNGAVTDNGDGTFTVATGVGGGGDLSSNTASSVDNELMLFSGTAGKTAKRATTTGVLKATSGVIGAAIGGTDIVLPSGNVATATALAANGGNCSAGTFPLGVDALGATEGCTALPTTITGTSGEIAASAATGAITLSLPAALNLSAHSVRMPSSTTLPATCIIGETYFDTDATVGQNIYGCTATNTWTVEGDGGAGGGGDFSSNTATSVDGEIVLFSGAVGKTGKRATGTGIPTIVSGVLSTPITASAGLSGALSDETGSGAAVFATNPVLVTPNIGTPSAGVLTNATGLPIGSGVSGLGTGVASFLGTPTSANLLAALTDETGTGLAVFATNPVLTTPNLGTPSAGVLTNATGLPISSGVSGLGTGVASFLATPSGANLATVLTDETGTGVPVFNIRPTLTVQDSTFTIQDNLDNTKQAQIMAGGITTGTTRTYTLPDASTTFVGTDVAQTLTNKTLTTPVIGDFTNAVHAHTGTAGGGTLGETSFILTDITTNNATTSAHGFMQKYPGGTTTFLRADGTFATPAGGGNVSNTGTPTSGQAAEFTAATVIQGVAVTGTGSYVKATSPTLVTPALGTPASGVLTNATGLPVATGISGLGTGVATLLGVPSSANLLAALTDETGTGSAVFATSPVLVTPNIGTPSAGVLTNATGLPLTTGVTGTLPIANGGTNLTTATDDNVMVGNGTTWQSKALTDCDDTGGNHLNYDTTTNVFSCGTSSAGSGGTVNSGVAGTIAYYPTTTTVVDDSTALAVDGTSILSRKERVTTKSATATLTTTDGPIVACTAAADVTLTLPAASSAQGHWTIIKVDGGSGACKVQRAGSDTINGATTTVDATSQWMRVDLDAASSTNWSSVLGILQVNLATQVTGVLPNANGGLGAAISTNGLIARTGTDTHSERTITGTANQIAVSNGDGVSGNPTLSIPSSPTLPGTTTGTFSGPLSGNATTATALAANGANCAVSGTFPNGVDGVGAAENCVTLSAVNPQTATYQALAADFDSYKTITVASGTFTITLVASGSQPAAGKYIRIINYGSGVVTIARSGQNINGGVTSLTLAAASATAPTSAFVVSDGTNYFAMLAGGASGSGDVTDVNITTTAPVTGGTTCASGACAFTLGVSAASDTATGIVELATAAETTTGTDAARAVTPDGLAGSDFGKRYITIECIGDGIALSTGDGKCYWPVHPDLAGWVIVGVSAHVGAATSSSGAVNVDIDVCGAVATGIRCSGTNRDLLSTNITIDASEDGTETAAAAAVINTANDDLATGEWVRWNIDGAGTGTQGLYVTIVLQKP